MRLDESTWTWSISEVIDTGWQRYDQIAAADTGVLYARAGADGKLYRSRFDPATRAWVTNEVWAGNAWNQFDRAIFSVGGNTLFGVPSGGDVVRYRHREWDSAWAISGRDIGDGWQQYVQVAATPDACQLTADVYRR